MTDKTKVLFCPVGRECELVVACMPRNTQGVLLPLPAMFADRYKKYMEMYDPNEGDWK